MTVTLLAMSSVSPAFIPGVFTSDHKASLALVGLAVGLSAGVVEELGWPGFAIPTLRQRHGVIATGLMVSMVGCRLRQGSCVKNVGVRVPSPDTILNGLTTIANDWRWLAITWHVLLAALLVVLVAGWRPSTQLVGHLLIGPLLSVSVLAWLSGNPFSGRVFAVLAAMLVATATRFPNTPVQFASPAWVASGLALIMFGWTYPHFVATDSPTYLYASPFGTLPCPTLSVVIGMTLFFRNLRSRLWSTALVVTGLLYGAFGVFSLGVVLDWGLLAASALLATAVAHDHIGWRSVRADLAERTRRLPGDQFIPEPLGTLTHAITIGRPPQDVWPWLIQMGAGSRAGWYSYDVLDNGGRPSATRVVPQLQDIAIGTLFPALPGVTEGFAVLAFEPNRSLILGWPNSDGQPLVTWAFVLEARDNHYTKLIVRARGGQSYRFHGLPWWLSKPIVHVVHFAMQRKQLLGIARRVESSIMTMPDAGPASEFRRHVA